MSEFTLSPTLRAELNRKSDLHGAWETLKDWGLLVGGFALSLYWPHPVSYVLTVLLLAAAMAGMAILQHEASHRSLFATPWVNEFVGQYLAALPILQSMPGYRRYHMQHHRLAGTADDPDRIMTSGYPVSLASLRRKLWRDVSGQTGVKSIIGMLGMMIDYWEYELTGRVVRVQPAPQGISGYAKAFIKNRGHVALLMQVGLWATLYTLGNGWLYGLWAIAYLFVFPLCMRLRQLADHAMVVDENSPNALLHARSSEASWWEKLLFSPHNEHYHLEHHLLPTAPCWQLPKLHAELLRAQAIPAQNYAAGGLREVLARVTLPTSTLPQ